MNAIVYCSQTGHTAQYARLLAQRLELPAYPLPAALDALPRGAEVIFLSWLCAGMPKGWKKAHRAFHIAAMAVVGLSTDGRPQLPGVLQRCGLSHTFPLFYLPGGYEKAQLRGGYRILMNAMEKKCIRQLLEKPRRTDGEEAVLELWQHGGNLVDAKHLAALAAWCRQARHAGASSESPHPSK